MYTVSFKQYLSIYLAALGLSRSLWGLLSHLVASPERHMDLGPSQHVGS